MSESARLTRKQLREMGKLAAKPDDAPALTDTQELRLRRPSRKEMREVERAERERNAELAQKGAAQEAAPQHGLSAPAASGASTDTGKADAAKLVRKSVFERFELPHEQVENSSAAQLAQNQLTQSKEMRKHGVALENTGKETSASVSNQSDNGRASNGTSIFASAEESATAQVPSAQAESLREQLFARIRKSEMPDFANPEQSVTVPDLASQPRDRDIAEKEVAAAPSVPVELRFSESAPAQAVEVREAVQEKATAAAVADITHTSNAANPLGVDASLPAQEEDAYAPRESEVEAAEVQSEGRSWFVYLILAIIFALTGYLAGSWLNSTFFAAELPVVNNVLAHSAFLQ